MNKIIVIVVAVLLTTPGITKTPYEIVDTSPDAHWRDINQENTLYITLETGVVIVEMAPQFAPLHVNNTKELVREGIFNGTSFYRVVDGFVAQGGPTEIAESDRPKKGQLTVPAEFTVIPKKPFELVPLNAIDGYAPDVGYVEGFATAWNKDKNEYWLTHCYGSLAMGRAKEAGSGGTELYIVIGQAQRYLDKNTTVFGRVITGMEYIQSLKRSSNLKGGVNMKGKNKIVRIQVGSDLKPEEVLPLQTMKTNSVSFKALIESRKNRDGEWFVYQHNYIDVCSISIPVRLKGAKVKSFN